MILLLRFLRGIEIRNATGRPKLCGILEEYPSYLEGHHNRSFPRIRMPWKHSHE